jgi:hypothetical protein
VLAGRPPASTKGHFYGLKVAGGCHARQQKPILAAGTNHFWPSEFRSYKSVVGVKDEIIKRMIFSPLNNLSVCTWPVHFSKNHAAVSHHHDIILSKCSWSTCVITFFPRARQWCRHYEVLAWKHATLLVIYSDERRLQVVMGHEHVLIHFSPSN